MINRTNKNKKFGRKEKVLIVKLMKRSEKCYDVVLSRKKTKTSSRVFKFGYYQVINQLRFNYSVLSLDFKKLASFLSAGALLDTSFVKIITN